MDLDAMKLLRIGSCSTTESNLIPFTGRIDEISLWNASPTTNAQLASSVDKFTGLEADLLGYWTFDDAPAQFPYVWSDALASHMASRNIMDAEIRIQEFDSSPSNSAPLFLDFSGASQADADVVDREGETVVRLSAHTSPSCAKTTFRIVLLPIVGNLYDAVTLRRGLTKGTPIMSAGVDLTGSSVVFEIPTDLVTAATESTFAYVAWCADGTQSLTGRENVVEMTLGIRYSQPYPQLVLDDRLQHHLQIVNVVDPDEDEYNAASTFSLTITGGQSLSASVETELTMAATISQVQNSNSSVSAIVVEGTGTSSEINAILASTYIETNSDNPVETHYHLDVVGGTPKDKTSYEYFFSHELVRMPSISEIWPTEMPASGSSIQVRGKNFVPVTLCLISDQIVSEATFVSMTQVICAIPQQSVTGILALAVAQGPAAHERSNSLALRVRPSFTLWDIQPASGIVFPGSEIIVRGAPDFQNGTVSCRFVGLGGEKHRLVTPHAMTVDSIACQVPQANGVRPNSTFELEISQNLFDFVSVGAFRLFPPPVITRLSPPRGFRGLRVQVVDVLGMNFIKSSYVECLVGSVVSPGIYVSPAKVQCQVLAGVHYSPASQSVVEIDLSFNGGADFTEKPLAFSLMRLAIMASATPNNSPSTGGTRVQIVGTGFVEEDGYSISLTTRTSRAISSLTFINSTCLEWTTPAVNTTGKTSLRLETGGSDFNQDDDEEASTLLFVFTEHPTIASVTPRLVRVGAENIVTVVGNGFGPFDSLRCAFAMATASNDGNRYSWTDHATFIEPSIVQCRIPALAPVGLFSIAVSNNGVDFSRTSNASFVRVYADVAPIEASVTSGPVTGGTEVVVAVEKHLFPSTGIACSFGNVRVRAIQASESRIRCVSPPWDEIESSGSLIVPVRIALNGLDFSAFSIPFRYFALPAFELLTPSVVPMNSSFTLEITGRYFASFGGLSCRLGSVLVVPARMMEAGRKVVCSPATANFSWAEVITVEVSMNGGQDFISSSISLVVRAGVTLNGLSVSRLLEGTSEAISVVGAGFYKTDDENVVCSFDHYIRARGEFVNAELIRCSVSPYLRPGASYSVRVSLNAGAHFSTGWAPRLDVYALPRFHAITPSFSQSTVTNVVEIFGSGFATTQGDTLRIACNFGDIGASVPAKVTNASHMSCAVPSGGYISEARRVMMQFVVEGLTRVVDSNLTFTFLPTIAVTRVFPTTLSIGQSTVMFIWGFRFIPSRVYSVRIGNAVVERATVADESTLVVQINISEAEVPVTQVVVFLSIDGVGFADTGRTVNLVRSSGDATRTTSSMSYAPYTSSVNVTICAASIPKGALATDYYCKASINNPKSVESLESRVISSIAGCLQCRMPPVRSAANSTIQIVHTLTGITIASTPFEWYEPSEVLEISPHHVLTQESSPHAIVVVGTGFRADLAFTCSFGSVVASSSTVVNETTAICTLPAGAVLLANSSVRVSNNRVDYSASSAVLRVIRGSIALSEISPRLVQLDAPANITIRGQHFVNGETYCFFSTIDETVLAVVLNNTLAQCTFSGVKTSGKTSVVQVALGATNEASTSARRSFMALASPRITTIYPMHGVVDTSITVTVRGSGFPDYEALYCHFGDLPAVRATRITDDILECSAPPSHRGLDVNVRVSIDEQIFSSDSIVFTYHDGAVINSMTPVHGSIVGGTRITLSGKHFDPRDDVVCMFGNNAIANDLQVVSSTQIVLKAPSSDSGTENLVKVICSASDEEIESVHPLEFDYVLRPQVTYIEPRMGLTSSSTLLRVYGRGFSDIYPLFCLIGDSEPSIAVVESESIVNCRAPPHRIGMASVRVVLDTTDTASASPVVAFEYFGMPSTGEQLFYMSLTACVFAALFDQLIRNLESSFLHLVQSSVTRGSWLSARTFRTRRTCSACLNHRHLRLSRRRQRSGRVIVVSFASRPLSILVSLECALAFMARPLTHR